MAFTPGITRYQKKKWLEELSTKIAAGSLKCAIYSTTTALDATIDPGTNGATAQTYAAGTPTGELSASGTGYTTGGYTISGAILSASGNGYQLDFNDIVTGAGTIPVATYGAVIYDTADSNRILAINTITVSQASAGGAMTFTVPANALAIS